MPRSKKVDLSAVARSAVSSLGAIPLGRKSGNPDFVSSSFYVPKKINIRFDRALLTLKAQGFELDRSDILSVLMDRFTSAVAAAEKQSDELVFESLLAVASDELLADGADISVLKRIMRDSMDAMKADHDRALQHLEELKGQWQAFLEKQDVASSPPVA